VKQSRVQWIGCAAVLAACQKDVPIDVSVIGPSGANPFTGAMGATRVRIGFEGDAMSVREVSVTSGAQFNLDLRPTDPRSIARLRVDVLRESTLLAQGATPGVAWLNVGSQQLRVFVQPTDSVVLAPGGVMTSARADFTLVSARASGAVAYTVPPGGADARPDQYFLPSHTQRPFTFTISAAFDGDTSVVPLSNGGVLLLRAERALVFTDTSTGSVPVNPVPPERRVPSRGDGRRRRRNGLRVRPRRPRRRRPALGAHRPREQPRRRRTRDLRPRDASRARGGPSAAPAHGHRRAAVPLVRGQDPACATCASMELWSPGSAATPLPSLGASLDRRSEFEAVCVQIDNDGSCTRLLVLGGVDNTSATPALAARDVLIDGECLRGGASAGPACVRAELELLSTRRRAMRAAVGFDGRRVVVTGGRGPMDAVNYAVDVIDATDVAMLRRVPGDRAIPAADPAVLAMADGTVLIAGGIDRETNRATANLWFVRGPLSPL
jgi:hypothetical protein